MAWYRSKRVARARSDAGSGLPVFEHGVRPRDGVHVSDSGQRLRRGSHPLPAKPNVVYRARYKSALRVTVASSAAPYGYTLSIWTSGAVLSHARGIPNAGEALLFLAGAVAAYALVGGLAFGGLSEQLVPDPARAVVWGGLHFLSVALAIGAASLVAHFVTDPVAWLLGGFLVTGVYLIASAAQLTIALTTRAPQIAAD